MQYFYSKNIDLKEFHTKTYQIDLMQSIRITWRLEFLFA